MKQVWIILWSLVFPGTAALASGDSCYLAKGALSSLPMPCEGTNIILKNPEYCGSCAVREQSVSKAPKTLDDVVGFYKDEKVMVGGGLEKAGTLKYKGPTCLGEKGEALSYIEYVRRREFCREAAEENHLPKGKTLELTGSSAEWLRKKAAESAKRDRERIQSMGGETLLAKMNERAEKFKISHQCLLGVTGMMKQQTRWGFDAFKESKPVADGKGKSFEDLRAKKTLEENERIAHEKIMKLISSGYRLSDLTKDFSRHLDATSAEITKNKLADVNKELGHLTETMGSFCGEPYAEVSTVSAVQRDIELTIPVTAYFSNSVAVLDSKKTDLIKAEIQSQILKNPDIARCGGGITGVDIFASSNRLANGDPYEKWDFKELSSDRAQFVRDQVLATMSEPLLEGFDFKNGSNVILGERNSGASGACPYRLSGPEEGPMNVSLDPKYTQKGSKEQLEMEAAKVVKVALRFKSKCSNSVESAVPDLRFLVGGCVQPEFSCVSR